MKPGTIEEFDCNPLMHLVHLPLSPIRQGRLEKVVCASECS